MPNYKQTTISGEAWVRSSRVEINNPFQAENPSVTFFEEKLCNFSDGSVIKDVLFPRRVEDEVKEEFSAETASTSFPILDDQGNETGRTATFADVHQILSSLYIFSANRRDIRYAEAIERERIAQEEMQQMLDQMNNSSQEPEQPIDPNA